MVKERNPSKETLERWHQDPNNWKFGILYYNKEDKRIFPPKRKAQFGWTVNFANPISILAILAIIIVTLILTKLKK
jgi:uncharacterized membrane protein